MLAVPDRASLPLHEPLAVQAVELVDFQVIVADWPGWIEVGLTVRVTVGEGGVPTITVAEAEALPLAPPQVSV